MQHVCLAMGMACWLLFSGCNTQKATESTENALDTLSSQPISTTTMYRDTYALEIAVRKVKSGQLDAFKTARTHFISLLKQQEGVIADREFMSFYALPEPDDTEVYIGMTTWASPAAAGAASEVLMPSPEAAAFFSTLDFKAYVMAQLLEGDNFDLKTLASKEGQVLEVAVRAVNEGQAEAFQSTRKAFVDMLSAMDGVLASYEFKVISEHDQTLTVGMTVYTSQKAFQEVAGAIMTDPITQAYFATFTPVASQYAIATPNS